MKMKQVCEKYHISPDTLRYYERVGVIPPVHRAKNGVRDFTEEDIGYLENALCMRSAGVPVEMVIEYMELCRQGDETFSARRDLLKEVRQNIQSQIKKCRQELERLEYKIQRYEAAVETGKLVWDQAFSFDPETGTFACQTDASHE